MRAFLELLLVGLMACGLCGLGCGGKKAAREAGPEAAQAPPAGVKAQQPEGGKEAAVDKVPLARKIIYTGILEVVVENFADSARVVRELVKENKGYVVNFEDSSNPGAPRSAHWKVRIPVDRFDAFRDAVMALGEVKKNRSDSEDVTDEFYDLDKRIKNKQREEASLLELLKKTTEKLTDILEVRKELSRVREEIERLQGKQERLANLASMTTIDVTLYERKTYVAPQAPSFGSTVSETFEGSVNLLVGFGKALVLLAVALAPWLAALIVLAIPLALIFRMSRRRRRPLEVIPVQRQAEGPASPPT